MLTVQTKTEKITKVFEGKLKDKDAFFFSFSCHFATRTCV